jgi:predicted ATPase/DNA-binding SARP family transcriptional activator
MSPRWRVRLLGGLQVERDTEVITRFRTHRTASLLAYLAYHQDRPHGRERLCELLWPEAAGNAVRHRLRTALSSLRSQLETGHSDRPVFSADRTSIQLTPDTVTTDVMEFTAELERAARAADPSERSRCLRRAVQLYTGELLPGHTDAWVLQEREWLAERYFRALGEWLADARLIGEWEAAIAQARRGLALDPLREEIHQELMRLLAASGQPGAALTQYRQLERRMREELGARPNPTSEALARAIREDRHTPPIATAPAPPTGTAPRHNLPIPLTRFIGRARDLAALKQQLMLHRLVTLVGAGGCGKTRLALEAARELGDAFTDGVWWTDLAPLGEASRVAARVAETFGVREKPGRALTATLIDAIRSRRMLLILDNCEHLIEACALLAEELLRSCSHLRVLATSREPLACMGETRYLVSPLSVPDDVAGHDPEHLLTYESVCLLAERAGAVRPGFGVTDRNSQAISAVCRRLDGIPLAIELAAARTAAMPIEQVAARLDDCFTVLVGGARTSLPRHRTLQASIDWSYRLLSEAEQILLDRLSVFPGLWTLEAAEAVCSGGQIGDRDVPGHLAELVAKSLVTYLEEGDTEGGDERPARYRLLDTVRQYAAARLAKHSEPALTHSRHHAFFLRLAEASVPHLHGEEQAVWLERLELHHDDFRSALAWSLQNAPAAALRLAIALSAFWETRGHFSEGYEWLRAALDQDDGASIELRMQALDGAERLAYFLSDFPLQRRLLMESLQLHHRLEDRHGAARVLNRLALGAMTHGDYDAGRSWCEEGLALLREPTPEGNAELMASLLTAGMVTLCQGDFEAARAFDRESLALAQELGDRRAAASALQNTGLTFALEENPHPARQPLAEALETFQELKDQFGLARSYYALGYVSADLREFTVARSHFRRVMRWVREAGMKWGVSHTLDGFARVAAREGDWARAARLLAATEAVGRLLHSPIPPAHRPVFERNVATARWELGDSAFASLWSEGSGMSVDDAVHYAMDE